MRNLSLCVIYALAACGGRNNNQCGASSDCDLASGGMCLAANSGNQWCAYPDPECPGGYRYSTQDIGDGVSGQCVPGNNVDPDGGMDSSTTPPDAAPAHYVVTYGGSGAETLTDMHAVSGGVLATGSLASNAMLGTFPLTFGGGYAFVVAKLVVDGSISWARSETTDGALLFAAGVGASPSGDAIIAGTFTGTINLGGTDLLHAGGYDMFLVKYSAIDGSHMWSVQIGAAGDEHPQAMAVDSAGDIYVTGYYAGTANFGGGSQTSAGGNDVYVAKYSGTNGSYIWGIHAGSTANDTPIAIAVDAGRVTVAGVFRNTINFGGNDLVSAGSDDIFVASFNTTNGNHVWSERFGSGVTTSNDNCSGLVASGGAVYLIGGFVNPISFGGTTFNTQGMSDVYIAKLDAGTGTHVWSKAFGGTANDVPARVIANGANVVLTGYFTNTINFGGSDLPSAGGTDIFVATLQAADGAHVDSFRSGGSDNDQGTALAADSGGLVVGGNFSGVSYFGTAQETSGGSLDAFAFRP
jgi:outer membrane protein assembly factor BamB